MPGAAQAVAAPWLPVEAVTTDAWPCCAVLLDHRQRTPPLERAQLMAVLALEEQRATR